MAESDQGNTEKPNPNFDTHPNTGASNTATTSRASAFDALRQDVPTALLILTLILMPLYRTAALEDSFNTPKLALAMILGVLTAIGLLARTQSARMKLRWYPAPWLLVGLAVWQALSVLWSQSKPLGVNGTVYFATFAVLGWLFYRGPRSIAAVRALFHGGAIGATLTAAWVLYDDFTGGAGGLVARLPDWRGHLAAGLGNSGHIAGMVGMFLPWVLLLFLRQHQKNSPRRWLLLPVIALMFAALTVTWSVGSAGATIISLLIWATIAWRTTSKNTLRWTRLIPVTLAGLAVVAFYFIPNPANPHKPTILKQAFSSARWEAGWPTRVVIWKTTWQMIRENPMIGVGTGNFTFNYTQQVVDSVIKDPELVKYSGAFTNDAHNDYMQLWAEGGVFALAIWMAILSTFFIACVRMLRTIKDSDTQLLLIGAGAGMTVFALDGLMSFPMRLPAHFTMAVFFISIPGVLQRLQTLGGNATTKTDPAHVTRTYSRRLRTGGVGILLTLAACVWHHGHRVVAEYYMKAGRTQADAAVVGAGSQLVPAWTACDMIYQQTLTALASGASDSVIKEGLDQMAHISNNEAMKNAGELFQKSMNADRWYANVSSRMGQLLLFQNNFGASAKVSRRTLKTLQAYEIHERMGAASYFMGNMKLAKEHWIVCLTRRPENADFYQNLISRTEQGK